MRIKKNIKRFEKKEQSTKKFTWEKGKDKGWYEGQKKDKEEDEKKGTNIRCEAWKYINKYTKKKVRGVIENIQMDEWSC